MRQLILIALVTASVASPAAAQDRTPAQIEAAIEKHIIPKLTADGHTAVWLKPVVWAETKEPAVAGAGLAQQFADTFAKNKIGLTVGSRAVLAGTLARITDELSDPPAPALKLVLRLECDGKSVCEVPILILMENWIPIDPVDVAISPKASPKERARLLTEARENPSQPQPPPGGTVHWNQDKTIGLEMLLAKTDDVNKARNGKRSEESEEEVNKLFTARVLDPQSRVRTESGESCRFRLINKNAFTVAGTLRVAGVDWSEFSLTDEGPKEKGRKTDEQPKPKQRLLIVVPGGSSVVIKGFYRSTTSSLMFDVKCLPVTLAGRQTPDAGVVSFQYAAAWKKGEKPAPGEDAQLSGHWIGEGTSQPDKFEIVELVVGKVRGNVKLEYGSFK